ncbi:hypothetical protein TWF730_003072 [Orbilia blumenaviensis]|uniref:Uncharacterized protein n=1 Tax=Orbilia blumenaviensis TaxID=1796055 RepID=A0AAV9U802_9PEZI
MSETTSATSSTTLNPAIESYKTLVDDYVKNGLNLSTGAKIGIGVGAAVVGLVIIGMIVFIIVRLRRSRSSESHGFGAEGKDGSDSNRTEEQIAAEARRMRALDNM